MKHKIIITTIENAPNVPFDLDGKIMFSSDKLELVHLTLIPGEKIEPHIMPFDVLFFVFSGNGILNCDAGKIEGKKNTSIFVPSGALRGWENTGKSDLKLLVIKDLG